MHVHVGPTDGLLHMAAGVTSVRDLANDNDALLQIKRDIESGTMIGPRITMRGFMDGRGPYTGPTKVFVDTEAEARSAIDNYAKHGYDGIKVYSSIKPELMPTIIKIAHDKGLRVSGHVPAFMTAQQFVEAGADEIQHINMVFLNFFFDEVKDTRTPAALHRGGRARRDAGSELGARALVRAAAEGSQRRRSIRRSPCSKGCSRIDPARSRRATQRLPTACRRRCVADSWPAVCRCRTARTRAIANRSARRCG